MAGISDFYVGTSKSFSLNVSLGGVAQDIRLDSVTLYMKRSKNDADADALLIKIGDVITSGSSGIALFTLLPADTKAIEPGKTYIEIVWRLVDGETEYIVYSNELTLLERVSDPPA